MKQHLPMLMSDYFVEIIQSIPSSNQYCLRYTNEVHPIHEEQYKKIDQLEITYIDDGYQLINYNNIL